MTAAGFAEFIRDKVGPNWVIARRTSRLVRQYGDDVVCLTPKRYDKLVEEYERTTLREAHGTGPARMVVDSALDLLALARHVAELDLPLGTLQERAQALVSKIEGHTA